MENLGPWNTDDFDSLSWHDVHVHGFHFDAFNPDEGTANLTFDIDYILKCDQTNELLFTICRAELIFHSVFGLKFLLDYTSPAAGMCPFSIAGIDREPLIFPTGYQSFSWRIPINWPRGSIEFQAPRFTQKLVGELIIQSEQSLSPEQRA